MSGHFWKTLSGKNRPGLVPKVNKVRWMECTKLVRQQQSRHKKGDWSPAKRRGPSQPMILSLKGPATGMTIKMTMSKRGQLENEVRSEKVKQNLVKKNQKGSRLESSISFK